MIKLLARAWRVGRAFRRLHPSRRNAFARAPRLPPNRAFTFLLPIFQAVDKPKDWDPDFGKDDKPDMINNLQKLKLLQYVKELLEQGRTEEVEKILENAVETARRTHNMEWTNILLLILAKVAYNNKNYKKAEEHYLELNNNFNMPQEKTLLVRKLKVHTAFDLAKIYEITNEHDKAEKLYKHCLSQIQVMNVGSEDYPWATTVLERVLDSYSLFLADRSRLKEALHYRNMVYSLVKVFHGPESERACYCLNEMGRLSALLGEDEDAMEFMARALRIGKRIPLEGASLCAIYVNNGLLLLRKRLFSKAQEFCSEAKRLARVNADPYGNAQADACLQLIDKELSTA